MSASRTTATLSTAAHDLGRPAPSLASARNLAARLCAVALIGALLALLPGAGELTAQDVDVSGTWNMTVESQQGTTNPTVTLEQDGQSLTGQYSSQMLGQAEVTGSVNGNEITFSFTANVGGQSIPASYTATVEGGEMSGNLTLAGQAAATFTATRAEG